jgi:hypothetical protein
MMVVFTLEDIIWLVILALVVLFWVYVGIVILFNSLLNKIRKRKNNDKN